MRRRNILVVEDNPMNRQLLRDVLEHRGHRVLAASTVNEARTLWRKERIEVVLLDIHLTDSNGIDCLQEMRTQPALAKIPIIAVTAFAMPGDRERFLRAGFDGYLSKPIDTRRFSESVEAFLKEP